MGKSAGKGRHTERAGEKWRWRTQGALPTPRAAQPDGPRRRLCVERLETRALLASDLGAGSLDDPIAAPLDAADLPSMEVRVEVARWDGAPASTLQAGEPFVLSVVTRDLRAQPEGVFAVYVDLRWDADRAVVVGPAEVVTPFVNAPSGTPKPGELDELGAFAGLDATGEGSYAVVQIPLQAVTPGELAFTLDPADELPLHALLMYGRDDLIDPTEVRMVGARVVVEGGPLVPAEEPPATEQTAAPEPTSDAATLLLAGTLEGASLLGDVAGADTSAGPATNQDATSPESELLLLDAGSDPLRRLSHPPSDSDDPSEQAAPAEESTDKGTADLGTLLPE